MDINVPAPKILHKSANIVVKMSYAQSLEAKLNGFFGLYGDLQKEVDQQFMLGVSEYMPMDTGGTIQRMFEQTTVGSGLVQVSAPWIWFLYYGFLMVDPDTGSPFASAGSIKVLTDIELQYKGAPRRGSHWDTRWAADNYDSFITRMQSFTDKNLKL